MKKVLQIITIFLLSQFTLTSHARTTKLPSNAQVIKLIKQGMQSKDYQLFVLSLTGFEKTPLWNKGYLTCKNTKLRSIKLIKRGKGFNSYEGDTGSYIDSWFNVKFFVKGSCELSHPAKVDDEWIHDVPGAKNGVRKAIKGRVPLRHIPVEATITTDSYGDWTANNFRTSESDYSSEDKEKRKRYRSKLYDRLHQNLLYEEGDHYYDGAKRFFTKGSALPQKSRREKYLEKLPADQRKVFLQIVTLLDTHPKVKKIWLSRSEAEQTRLFNRLIAAPGSFSRELEFKSISRKLLRTRKTNNQRPPRAVQRFSGSVRHSHGGRFHSHKLPPQGKAHRHGNGPLGR